MNDSLDRRLSFVASILAVLGMLIVYRLVSIQFGINSAYFTETALTEYRYKVTVRPPRGEIYDRGGVLLATNVVEYEIGLSPVLIYDRQTTAQQLANVVGISADELLADMSSPRQYVLLVRPAPAAMGQAVMALKLDGVSVTPLNRRFYPHGSLAAHELGFVGYDDVGYYGVEGFYNSVLSGKVQVSDESRIPFEASGGAGLQPGSTLYLTLDSEVQYLSETALAQALSDTGATSGTIIVMDPRTGEILAMASAPTFDPNRFYAMDLSLFSNPAISQQYEPGSTSKVMTMGIALDTGAVQVDSTYDDTGVVEVGGATIYNWDRAAHGVTSMTDLLAHSLNVGAAKVSLLIGPTRFYHGLDVFGIGKLTGVDLEGEASGQMRKPGQTDWHEADLAENSFGQALAATPLQMIVAVASVANNGLMMQPHIVARKIDPDNTVTTYGPTVLGRTVSQQTASYLSQMLADGLRRETKLALVPGYTVVGKTGTAQIPIPGGYDPDRTIASFIGWGPLDDPRFIVLVKLDRPTVSPYGSETAAPAFSKLVQRLVVLLEIPPDSVRAQVAGGG
jgi:cell division protein FtsI/penicillin-binding protein 2